MTNSIRLMKQQKVAIITGGNSGIGRATAVALARQGVNITIAARRPKEGEETVKLVKDAGSEGIFVKTDVTNEDDIRSLVERSTKKFGRLDYAFNNAGIEESMTPLVDQRSDIFDQIINVNVKGVWLSMKYEIPEMIKSGGGAIVNMSSVAGVMGFPQMPIYIASKHAVLGLTKSAALEYARSGIRINAVAPGAVNTDMAKRVVEGNPQLSQTLTSMHPIGRTAEPEEIADVVSWLLSDKSTFVLGHTLLADGGIVSR
ncbi:MAG: SDR family oxidoreductase [Nitrososphaeraceae archaeon]|jgi:NAD(P)-dependent dehydrogenase (short-subunit alcohol dehydrogenase family)